MRSAAGGVHCGTNAVVKRPPGWLALLAAAQLFSSCATTAQPLPPSPPVIEVIMDEYHFVLPQDVPTGRVVFRARNAGGLVHDLDLISIPEEFPLSITEQVRGEVRQAFPTKAVLHGRPPGAGGEFAVDLGPGRYALTCFLRDPDGLSHAMKGMAVEFRAR